MRSLLKTMIFTTVSLAAIAHFFPDVRFANTSVLVLTGVVLTFLMLVVKPFLKILLLPVNLITFGLFAWMINIIILYLAVLLVPGFEIGTMKIPSFEMGPFLFQTYTFSRFWSFFLVSFFVALGNSVLAWIL